MKRIFAVLTLVFLLCTAVCAVLPISAEDAADTNKTAEAVYGTPTVDGVVDNVWNTAAKNELTIVYADTKTTSHTATFRVMWDETYLYFLVEVTDTTIKDLEYENKYLGGNLWRRDGVAFTFSPNNDRTVTTGQVAPAFWCIIALFGNTANWNNVPQQVFISEDGGTTKMYATSVQKDAEGKATGYILEAKFNLKPRYADMKMEAGTLIGFDMYTNDNNGDSANRDYGRAWNDINSYKNNSVKGTIKLMPKAEETTPTETTPTETTPTETTPTETTPEETTPEETRPVPPLETPETSDGSGLTIFFASATALFALLAVGTALVRKKKA